MLQRNFIDMIENNSDFWNKQFVIVTILSYFFLSLSL